MVAVKKHGTHGTLEARESFDELTKKQYGDRIYEICTNPSTSYLRHEFKGDLRES